MSEGRKTTAPRGPCSQPVGVGKTAELSVSHSPLRRERAGIARAAVPGMMGLHRAYGEEARPGHAYIAAGVLAMTSMT